MRRRRPRKWLIIRQATAKDRPAIRRLIRMYPGRLMQNHLPETRAFFVATLGDEVIGCCALPVYSMRLAEIRSLAVDPRYKRKGVAERLIRRCTAEARSLGIFQVLSITSEVRLFARVGFKTFRGERTAMLRTLH